MHPGDPKLDGPSIVRDSADKQDAREMAIWAEYIAHPEKLGYMVEAVTILRPSIFGGGTKEQHHCFVAWCLDYPSGAHLAGSSATALELAREDTRAQLLNQLKNWCSMLEHDLPERKSIAADINDVITPRTDRARARVAYRRDEWLKEFAL